MRRIQQGYTLIEIIIAIVLMGILLKMSIPSLITYFLNSKIRAVADEMQAGLQQTKTEAIRRNSLANFTINNTGWSIVVPGQNGNADTTLLTRTPRNNETNIAVNASANTIGFNGQGYTSPLGTYTIQITSPTSGTCVSAGGNVRCLNLTISAAGSIKMCDPALAATDPRAC